MNFKKCAIFLTLGFFASGILQISLTRRAAAKAASLGDIQWSEAEAEVSEGSESLVLKIQMSRKAKGPASVRVTTTDVTAKSGSDYKAISEVVTFGPDEVEKKVSIPILNDSTPEAAKIFYITLSAPVSAGMGAIDEVTVLINDDDATQK